MCISSDCFLHGMKIIPKPEFIYFFNSQNNRPSFIQNKSNTHLDRKTRALCVGECLVGSRCCFIQFTSHSGTLKDNKTGEQKKEEI